MVLREVFVVDAQKRQKVMLVAVAVLALGAGSYWYLGRDSGGSKSAVLSEGTVVRKEKKAQEEPTSKRKKDPKAVTREEPTTVERKEREAPEETTVERKKKREDKTKEKKKTVSPAA
jgi:chromatin remodeling complex protein RSC6